MCIRDSPFDRLVPSCELRVINGRLGSFIQSAPGEPFSVHSGRIVRDAIKKLLQGEHIDIDEQVDGLFGNLDAEELAAAGLFDIVIRNQDRHDDNFFVDNDRVSLIDHGYTFTRQTREEDEPNITELASYREKHWPFLRPSEATALQRIIDTQAHGLKNALEPERYDNLIARVRFLLDTWPRTSANPEGGSHA